MLFSSVPESIVDSGSLMKILSIHDALQLSLKCVAIEIVGENPFVYIHSSYSLLTTLLWRLMLKSPIIKDWLLAIDSRMVLNSLLKSSLFPSFGL